MTDYTGPVSYLWRATQSEPGCDGVRYTLTTDKTPPARSEPVKALPGLVYQESLYDDWKLMGAVNGTACEGFDGDMYAEMATPKLKGQRFWAAEIALLGYYTKE